MRYLDSWATRDRKLLVYFTEDVIRTLSKSGRSCLRRPETGGILLGRRRGRHFEIQHATSPFPQDQRYMGAFVRERAGHQEIATALWSASGGEVDYVGEWHTHPEKMPTPSSTDFREWMLLANDRPREAPLLAVIVGTTALYVALLSSGRLEVLSSIS